MTKKQFEEKVGSTLPDVCTYLEKETKRLFLSSDIDSHGYGNDYQLPNLIVHIALLNLAEEYRPLSGSSKDDIRNLKHF